MVYQVILKRSAEKELEALQANIRERINKRLLTLQENPPPIRHQKITRRGKLSPTYWGLSRVVHG